MNRINNTLDGSNEFAFINTEIKFIGDDYPYVKTFFHPSRSYVYDDNKNLIGNRKLLTHELYHFHITEYIARKMRKEITKIKNNKEEVNISKLMEFYKEEENKMQKRYDEETYHSYYIGEQLKWQKNIDSLLNTLKKYK
ncbi:hypothetical protein [uncultured Flavobacterium sp.]|uniref:hypothetical protein n=1 Tax=uncultured Flavobacterium sp. TaxID=165435 RepID=UPI0025DF83FE|nr:hypothetical protein [uncultured Flavobacterium sp.]